MTAKGIAALAQGIRPLVVLHRLGQLLLPMAGLSAVPMVVALALGETGLGWRLAVVTGVVVALGGGLSRLETAHDVRANEAMSITALTFILASAAMIWPMAATGMDPLDAWFESVSGVTTTGLTMLADVEERSAGLLFTRAWLQWYGGLAIVALALALVLEPGAAAKHLASTDSGIPDMVGGTRMRARLAFTIYVALTVMALIVLLLAGLSPWEATLHGLTAVSTGGFSSHGDSLLGLGGWPVQMLMSLICLSGAIAFSLYVMAWRGEWRMAARDSDLRGVLGLSVIVALLVILFMVSVGGRSWGDALHHGPLLALSAQTAAGFSSLDVATLDPATKLVTIGSMFIGGDSGSTAGGIKIGRLLVLLALIRYVLARTALPPHAVAEPMLGGRHLTRERIQAALAVVTLHGLVIFLSWLIFLVAGHDPLDALFEVTSAVGTVGLSTGVTETGLAPALKLVLIADMLMGRLEVVALLVLFYPMTWLASRTGNS